MKQSILYTLPLIGAAAARPDVWALNSKREVPQEHSHRNVNLEVTKSLQLNNPDKIQDPIFGLLGAAAGIKGAGNIKDADCLQQATADQAFTNAKAAGDVNGMTFAMIFRTLERNTGSVGLASVPCQSIKAVNPEIAALQQHQDPAGEGAQALNKQIATQLAQQIAAIGGDVSLANEASTFAPGQIGDQTGAGNTCDDATDDAGCINTLKLRVDDLSADEIAAIQAGAGAGNATGIAAGAAANATEAVAGNNATAVDNGKAAKGKGKGKGKAKAKGKANKANKGAAADQQQAAACGAAPAADANAAAGAATGAAAGGAAAGAATGAAAGGAAAGAAAAGDFGSCTDPSIVFGPTSDGRKEDAFEPADLTNFNHGSANNIGIISSFICDQLTNKCKASADTVTKCDAADAAVKASGLTGQAAADSFNKALGV
ncbi:hypothetical protein DM02DRAFT_608989 [Periconia macrospinosa]|uniref:Uncharacterized protein n=1 Tax=Periconia macrospinosa TaxID=97972 RepID=A0A2V1EDM3_9PLEO|nr:hypothetical protein DM02DRAFT_608989 [Periconia macrospinosa]